MEIHLLARSEKKTKIKYYCALDYFVRKCANDAEYVNARFAQYYNMFFENNCISALTGKKRDNVICSIINEWYKPWI